jgi:hypothetical protein
MKNVYLIVEPDSFLAIDMVPCGVEHSLGLAGVSIVLCKCSEMRQDNQADEQASLHIGLF